MKNKFKQHDKVNIIGSCFTLIELLVVIAIIAILAGMLLPSLNKARERARLAQCTSHFKMVATGCAMYFDDNNDTYMSYINGESKATFNGTESEGGYSRMLAQYVGTDPNPYANDKNLGRIPLWQCPSDKIIRKNSRPQSIGFFSAGANPDYVYPTVGCGIRGLKVSVVVRPSKCPNLIEYWHYDNNYSLSTSGQRLSINSIVDTNTDNENYNTRQSTGRHFNTGGTNISFLDGHVEMIKKYYDFRNSGYFKTNGNWYYTNWIK